MHARRFGLFRFRSPLLTKSIVFFLFLRLLRCFSSPGSLCTPMDSVHSDGGLLRRVSPFRNLRVDGYLLLTAAYRSLSRLSSALSAKASSLRSLQLNLLNSFCCACSRIHSVVYLLFDLSISFCFGCLLVYLIYLSDLSI